MRSSILIVALLSAVSAPVFAQESEPDALSSTIRQVTVYSDRASVQREAPVAVTHAATVHAFKKLPGWVDEGSVRVSLLPAEAGRIVDVRVTRDYLARATDEAYRKAEASVREVADELAALTDELAILDAQARQIEAIKVFSLEKISKDAPVRDVKVESYKQVVTFISDSLRETAAARRAVELKRRQLAPELEVRQRKLNELQGLTQLEETTVLVTLEGSGSRSATLRLDYMLPGATWEPVHELRTGASAPGTVDVTSFAVVTQTSGEDWSGVKIAFSTQSSTQSNRIPELGALTLGDSEAAARVIQSRAASFDRAQAAFEGQNRMWNLMNAPMQAAEQMQIYDNNVGRLQETQMKTAQVFQTLGQRGTTALFEGQARATVRGDGQPVRVCIGHTSLEAKQAVVAVPEQSLNAVRTVEMNNGGDQPILPGSVALFQDGAFLGMTDIDFVAEGETFSLFLGVADQVKLSRILDRKYSSIESGKRTRIKVAYVVTVENLSGSETTVDLTDRVPVSENEEIEVDKIEVSGDKEPDARGLLKWQLTLKPKERKTFRIAYRLEYPPELVRNLYRNRMEKQKAMPSSPGQSYDFDASEDIMNLEKSF